MPHPTQMSAGDTGPARHRRAGKVESRSLQRSGGLVFATSPPDDAEGFCKCLVQATSNIRKDWAPPSRS